MQKTSGSAALVNVGGSVDFTAVVAGQVIQGSGIPFGATVLSKTDANNITISANATTSDTTSVMTGIFESTAYAAGDALGFPFLIKSGIKRIWNITVIDDAEQLATVNLLLFNSTFTQVNDNSAFALSDADAENVIAVISIANVVVLSDSSPVEVSANPSTLTRVFTIKFSKLFSLVLALTKDPDNKMKSIIRLISENFTLCRSNNNKVC